MRNIFETSWKDNIFSFMHHPFKQPPGSFQEYSGYFAFLHSGWISWTRIELQRNLSFGAFWKKNPKLINDKILFYFVIQIYWAIKTLFRVFEFLVKFLFFDTLYNISLQRNKNFSFLVTVPNYWFKLKYLKLIFFCMQNSVTGVFVDPSDGQFSVTFSVWQAVC